MSNKPHKEFNPVSKKEPRVGIPQSSFNDTPAWQFNRIDLNGEWGYLNATKEDLVNEILTKLKAFESMKWIDIDGKNGSHDISIAKICKEARKRLLEIEQDDIETIYSLRLTGKKRIWGIKDGRILKVIWWDPKHGVCPSLK